MNVTGMIAGLGLLLSQARPAGALDLVKDGRPYWLGMGCELPNDGVNFSGPWHRGR